MLLILIKSNTVYYPLLCSCYEFSDGYFDFRFYIDIYISQNSLLPFYICIVLILHVPNGKLYGLTTGHNVPDTQIPESYIILLILHNLLNFYG